MGSLCTLCSQVPGGGAGIEVGAGLPTLSETRDLLAVAGREVESRNP